MSGGSVGTLPTERGTITGGNAEQNTPLPQLIYSDKSLILSQNFSEYKPLHDVPAKMMLAMAKKNHNIYHIIQCKPSSTIVCLSKLPDNAVHPHQPALRLLHVHCHLIKVKTNRDSVTSGGKVSRTTSCSTVT